jgi:cytochrome b6-f complex iron-sulfur subunit
MEDELKIRQTKAEKQVSRREFIASGVGLGAAGLVGLAALGGIARFMLPTVTYLTPKKFLVKIQDLPTPGNELLFPDQRVIIQRHADGRVAAISLICTHLGCTVYRVATGYQCPCHGSQYDNEAEVVGGPAPVGLAWLPVKPVPGGQVEIDSGERVEKNSYFAIA